MKIFLLMSSVIIAVAVLAGCTTTGTMTSKAKPYPLDKCLVTDNELGSMGDPVSIIHEGQEIKFCCRPCISEFKSNPKQYLMKLPGR